MPKARKHKPLPQSLKPESCPHLIQLRIYLENAEMEVWAEANHKPTELWLACGRCERNVLLASE